MQKAGLLIGRGTFVVFLILMLLSACAQQAPAPTAVPDETADAEEAPEATATSEVPIPVPGGVAAASAQVTIDSEGNIRAEEIAIDPNTELALQFINLSEKDTTLSFTTGSGAMGIVVPAAISEGPSVTITTQNVAMRFDEAGIYQISCLDGTCSGSIVVTVGDVAPEEGAPEATGEAVTTPEATTEEGAEEAAPEATTEEGAEEAAPEATTEEGAEVAPTEEATEAEPTAEVVATPEATEAEPEPTEAEPEPTEAEEVAPTEEAIEAEPTAEVVATPEATEAEAEPTEAETDEATDGAATTATGDAAAGETLFNQTLIQTSSGVAAGCVTCHYVQADLGNFTGPNLAGLGNAAAERESGQTAEEYLYNSIVNPNEYVVEGFSAGIMPQNYGEILTEDEINNLVAYLLSLTD